MKLPVINMEVIDVVFESNMIDRGAAFVAILVTVVICAAIGILVHFCLQGKSLEKEHKHQEAAKEFVSLLWRKTGWVMDFKDMGVTIFDQANGNKTTLAESLDLSRIMQGLIDVNHHSGHMTTGAQYRVGGKPEDKANDIENIVAFMKHMNSGIASTDYSQETYLTGGKM